MVDSSRWSLDKKNPHACFWSSENLLKKYSGNAIYMGNFIAFRMVSSNGAMTTKN